MKRNLPAFDVLVDMARNDPRGLESLRKSMTNSIISDATNEQKRKRLEGLQFRVDLERERSKTALSACIKISEMMCQSLAELHKSMVTPLVSDNDTQDQPIADVLPFNRPDRLPEDQPG